MGSHNKYEPIASEDFTDEFEGIDEMKIRGINRTLMPSKLVNKPGMQPSLIGRSNSKASLVSKKLHSTRNHAASTNYSHFSSFQDPSFTDRSRMEAVSSQSKDHKKQAGPNIVEEVVFCIESENNTEAIYFNTKVDDEHKKVSKVIQVGFVKFHTDTYALTHLSQILNNFKPSSRTFSDKSDTTQDAFWWLFSRNILLKLKSDKLKSETTSIIQKELSEENVDIEEEINNVNYVPRDVVSSTPYSSRMIKKKPIKNAFDSFSFSELYNIFVNKLDKSIFEDYDLFYQIDIQGFNLKLNNLKTYAGKCR